MKKLSIILLFSFSSISAMQNQVTPGQTPQQIVAQALPNVNVPASLIPHVAAQITTQQSNGQELGADTTNLIMAAADAALGSSVSKKTTCVISSLATLIGALVTALATSYSCKS